MFAEVVVYSVIFASGVLLTSLIRGALFRSSGLRLRIGQMSSPAK